MAIVVLAVAAALAIQGGDSGSRRVSGEQTAPFLLSAQDVAGALAMPRADIRTTNPPVDVAAMEREVRRLPFVDVPLPDDRSLATVRRVDNGADITQAILYYADPSNARELDSLAARLLPMGFGLGAQPYELDGAEGARLWTAEGYRAISFRSGRYLVFVGSSGGDTSGVDALARAIRDRLPEPGSPGPGTSATQGAGASAGSP